MTEAEAAAQGNLRSETVERVVTLTLNRPVQRNALSPTLIVDLSAALRAVAARADVNAVVLTGAGKAFCSGLDLRHLRTLSREERVRYMRSAFDLFVLLGDLPQPTIAAVNGPAVAGGFDLAVFCDLRIAVPAARFAQPEIHLGATQFIYPLHTLVGVGHARELALTGDPITADEAHRIGLVNHLVDPERLMSKALALARTIASRPREALLATKRLGQQVPGLDRASAMALMREALDRSLGSDEHLRMLEAHLIAKA